MLGSSGREADPASDAAMETRLRLYKRPDVRALLDYAVNGHEEIPPTVTSEGYTYPEVNRLLRIVESSSLMQEVSQYRLFRRTTVDVEAACPECASRMTIHDSYACPFCKSPTLKRGTLLEHYKCGHVGLMDEFAQADNLICPKCRSVLRLIGTDYSKIQDTFRCEKCSRSFSAPSIIHRCLNCKMKFSYENAKLSPVYIYEFNEAYRQEVVSNCVVQFPIANRLREMGLNVQSPGFIKGQSGIEQDFDIVARDGDKNYVFAIATNATEVNQDVVATLFAKKFDAEVEKSFVVAIPKMNREGLKVASLYGIQVIEGADQIEVTKKIPALLQGKEQPQNSEPVSPPARAEVEDRDVTPAVTEAIQKMTRQLNGQKETVTEVSPTGKPDSRISARVKCTNCGRELDSGSDFCDQCGKILDRAGG